MSPEIEARLTGALLGSGRSVSQAANVVALLAGLGWLFPASSRSVVCFAVVDLCWIVEVVLNTRVSLDASLFAAMPWEDSTAAGEAVDAFVAQAGLRKAVTPRDVASRTRGALWLWRFQIAAFSIQLAAVAAGAVLRFLDS